MIFTRLFELLTATFSIFFVTLEPFSDDDNDFGNYCNDLKCERAASELLVNLNRSVEPCDDFYEHACGGWIAMNPVTEASEGQSGRFIEIYLKIHAEIAESFKTIEPNDIEALQKAKKFYDACMDWDAIERRGLSPLEAILTENGEWPLIVPTDKWNPQNFSWQKIHENIVKRVDVSSLFKVEVEIDSSDSNAHILTLNVPEVPSERLISFIRTKRFTKLKGYRDYVRDVAEAFKKSKELSVEDNDFQADITEMLKLEDKLNTLAMLPDEDDNDNGRYSRVMTIEALQAEWDSVVLTNSVYAIDWLKVISNKFDGTGIVINKLDKVSVMPGIFATKLATVLLGTPVRTIVNYMHWRVIDKLLHLTNLKIKNPGLIPTVGSGRSGICINGHKMIHAVSYLYVKKYSSKATTLAALEVVGHIRDAMKWEINQSTWLDDATKSVAREKVDAMTNFIGYPDWYDESGKIDDYYNELTVGFDYFDNVIAAKKFDSKIKLLRLRSAVSKSETDWISHPHIVNAQYDPQTNSLNFPSAILQSPFFVDGRSSVLNYGSFGAIVGHEISHGFDNTGRLYDKNGNKKKWWSQSAIDAYKTKAQCFVEQFDKYVIYEDPDNNKTVYVDGTQGRGENIADTTGYRVGFRAFQIAKNAGDIDTSKSRFLADISDEQLYFYQIAQTFCETVSEKGLRAYESDSHSPNRLRVIGALSNLKEFADAFNCPAGSPMNPAKKCLIWD